MNNEEQIMKTLKRQEKMLEQMLQGFYSLTSNVAWLVGVLKEGDDAAEDEDSEFGVPNEDKFPTIWS